MARQAPVSTVFTYSYRLAQPANPAMAGFSINMFSSDVLLYSCYDVDGQRTVDCRFNLRQGTADFCRRLMRQAAWLRDMPPRMAVTDAQAQESRIVFGNGETETYYCIDDFESLLTCSFGSLRGHYSRAVYNLLEDLTALLRPQGLDFMPDGFTWQQGLVQPVQIQNYPSPWAAAEAHSA